MVGYYLYGRDTIKKYHSYVNTCSAEDERGCFLKMASYHGGGAASGSQRPEKIYSFPYDATAGRIYVVGRTTLNTAQESPMADEDGRNTVFEHCYLFDGEDRKRLLCNTDRIFSLRPFCTRVDDILEERTSSLSGKKTYVYTFDDKCQDVFEERTEVWATEELLSYFGLEGEKLDELLYTLLHCKEKVYLMLPENTKDATDRALALMQKLLQILPPFLAESAGFLTYAHAYASYEVEDRYVPFGVRYVFLARTEENLKRTDYCKKELGSFLFCPECGSGVVIRPELYPVVEAMRQQLLTGDKDERTETFWSLLNANGVAEAAHKVSEDEMVWMYRFALCFHALVRERAKTPAIPEQEFGQCMERLLEYPEHWNKNLWEWNMPSAVSAYLQGEAMTEAFYPVLFRLYGSVRPLQKAIEDYFAAQISDVRSLRRCEALLGELPELKNAVWELLYQKESCMGAVLEAEFTAVQPAADDTSVSPSVRAGAVWAKAEMLCKKNRALVGRPEAVEYVRCYLERCTAGCRLAEEKTVLELSVARMNALELSEYGYLDMLAALSKSYIAELSPMLSKLKDAELRLLEEWPQELGASDAFRKRVENDKLIREFRAKAKANDAEATLQYLERLEEEQVAVIAGSAKLFSDISNILRCATAVNELKRKKPEKEKLFDRLHVRLLVLFPEYARLVLDNIMRAPLGGVASMHAVYNAYVKDREQPEENVYALCDLMQAAVLNFYEEYRMGRADRKAIRQEKSFLRNRLNLDAEALLGK